MIREVRIGGGDVREVVVAEDRPLVLIGGPCAIESRDHTLRMAESLVEITDQAGVQLVYKSCFDKDCRSSHKSFLGIGIDEGLEILAEVRREYGVPVTSDVSYLEWVEPTAEVVDMIQIPAYLSRQTKLLLAAGGSGKAVHVKKGQFLSPWNMKNAAFKIASTGNHNIILTDRGTFFGYNMLVNDMRNFRIMREAGYPVGFDCTHSIQLPGSLGTSSGGQREFIPALTRAALAAGADLLFAEIHDQPDQALCDATTQLPLHHLECLLEQAVAVRELTQSLPELDIIE